MGATPNVHTWGLHLIEIILGECQLIKGLDLMSLEHYLLLIIGRATPNGIFIRAMLAPIGATPNVQKVSYT